MTVAGEAQAGQPPASLNMIATMKRVWKEHLWVFWPQMMLVLGLMIILAATTGAYPLIIKYSYDMLAAGDVSMLSLIIVGVIVVTFIKGAVDYLQALVTSRLSLKVTRDLQNRAFAHVLHADYSRLTRESPGRLMTRVTSDVAGITTAFMAVLGHTLKDVLTIIALTGSMLYLDWKMTLLILCIYPIAAFPIVSIGRRIRRNAKKNQRELGGMTSLLVESLSSTRLLKTFRLEDYMIGRMRDQFARMDRLRLKVVRSKAALNPILEVLGGLAVAGVIGLASYRISQGTYTVGDFTGFVAALLMAAQPIRALGNLNMKIQEGFASAERYYELLDEHPRVVDRPGAKPLQITHGEISFNNVSFSYGDSKEAVRNFTLTVKPGTTVALVGRSGAGKSTIMNLVPRLYDPQTGTITIDGQDIRDVTVESLRNAISIVSQDITLFDDTIEMNIMLGRLDASHDDVVAAAKAAAAHEFIADLPDGYAAMIGDRGLRLSGGQRQRVALARAIVRNAPILLLDEATSALDAESERLVQEALAQFSRGRTTLVIAHRLSTVKSADMICVMEHGRIIEMGKHAELMAQGGAYALFCRSQVLTPDNSDHHKEESAGTGHESDELAHRTAAE